MTADKFNAPVFHVTTASNVERIMDEGLYAGRSSQASEAAIAIDVRYDAERPKGVVDLGVSRLSSIYAHPVETRARERKNGDWLRQYRDKLALMAITIPDLDAAYVCDAMLMGGIYKPEDYWASLATLREYRSRNEPMFSGPTISGGRCEDFYYMWPEVLIPDYVPPRGLTLVDEWQCQRFDY